MKKIFLFVASLMTTLFSAYAITLDPDLEAALPYYKDYSLAPPTVGSPVWLDDSIKYFYYKEIGNRFDAEKEECWDSAWALMNEQYYFALYRVSVDSVMNAPFIDVNLTRKSAGKYTVTTTYNTKDFPEMTALWEMCVAMKNSNTKEEWRERPRPYKYFGFWYKGKKYDVSRDDASSYPSGHGYFAGLFRRCMLYIDPVDGPAITSMMDEWAHCRLLLGAHWNTDVIDGKKLGDIAFDIAMNYPQFRNQVEAAKTEYETYQAPYRYTREHQHMNLNTLCYPKQIDRYSGATFYTMLYKEVDSNGNPVNIYLQEHEGALEAGKPYFYIPEEGSEKLLCRFSGNAVDPVYEGNGVYGVYADFIVPAGKYVTYNNKFTKAGDNVTLHEYRAYVDMSEVPTNPGSALIPGRKVLKISNTSEVATDIQEVIPTKQAPNIKVLSNGQLVIYNNDKQYNAVGQEIR